MRVGSRRPQPRIPVRALLLPLFGEDARSRAYFLDISCASNEVISRTIA